VGHRRKFGDIGAPNKTPKGNMKLLSSIAVLTMFCSTSFAAQGIVTLTAGPGDTNVVAVTADQSFKVVGVSDMCGNSRLQIQKDSKAFNISISSAFLMTMAGPASICLSMPTNISSECASLVTMDIQPSAFPPDKAVTVGAYSGNVKVTMEMSTDLVNWTPAEAKRVVEDTECFRKGSRMD